MSASATTERRIGALAAVALHAVALGALLAYEPARDSLLAAAPIMVDWIVPPRPETKPVPPVELPRPKPLPQRQAPRPVEAPPIVAVTPEAPSAAHLPPAPPAAPELPVAAAPQPAPVPVTPPIFNAGYLDNPPPAYPALSRRAGEQGRVILRVLVSAAGRAEDIEVRTSSGHARLDEAARETVKGWRFVPARRGEQPVPAWVLIPISFRLEG